MRTIILLILIIPFAAAVDFHIDTPTDVRQGSTITASVIMDNSQPVYGYEITITADPTYQTHNFTSRVDGGMNSFTQVNSTKIRAATVKSTGINTGNTSVLDINYTLPDAGNNTFRITAKSYNQNGSEMNTTTQNQTINVTGNILKIVSHTTDSRKTTLSICTKTEALNKLKFELHYNQLNISSSSASYNETADGANITIANVPAHATCEESASIDFNIEAAPGTNIPLTIQNVETTPNTTITPENGNIQYNGYKIQCENITAYRNLTAEMPIKLESYTSLQTLNFTMDTVFNITNTSAGNLTGDSLSMDTPGNVNAYLFIPPTYTNGQYIFAIENIIATTNETITHQDRQCKVTIADHCLDQDNDNFYYGTECGNITQDCDDTKAAVNQNATETCNGRDDDCDGSTDENVCTTSSGGGGGGGGGGSSASSSGSATAGTSGGFASFPVPEDTAVPVPDTPPKKKEKPIQTKLPEPEEKPEKAVETKPEPKKINLIAYVMGVLTLLGAGLLIVYEYIKHRHPH